MPFQNKPKFGTPDHALKPSMQDLELQKGSIYAFCGTSAGFEYDTIMVHNAALCLMQPRTEAAEVHQKEHLPCVAKTKEVRPFRPRPYSDMIRALDEWEQERT
eukprot:1161307-Pelagomonas_calceolata.AAC.3